MKILLLASLFIFVSCNGSGGGGASVNGGDSLGNNPAAGTSGNTGSTSSGSGPSAQQVVKTYTQTALNTVPNDLRLSDTDIQSIDGEVSLTAEEKQTLNDLKQ